MIPRSKEGKTVVVVLEEDDTWFDCSARYATRGC